MAGMAPAVVSFCLMTSLIDLVMVLVAENHYARRRMIDVLTHALSRHREPTCLTAPTGSLNNHRATKISQEVLVLSVPMAGMPEWFRI